MPFTAAHPAAVLPLRRLCPALFVWSGLLIGTVTPDLECFLTLRPEARYGVTFYGSFYFCLPAGLLLFALLQPLLRKPLTLLLPRAWREVVWPVAARPFEMTRRGLLSLVASILVGAWLHQIWDSFTHAGHWGVEAIPFLSKTLATFGAYELTAFRLVQHGSTMVGVACLALAVMRWRAAQIARPAPALGEPLRLTLVSVLVVAPLVGAALRAFGRAAPYEGIDYARQLVAYGVIALISFAGLGMFLAGVAIAVCWGRLVGAADRAR